MIRVLKLNIVCGDQTCASEPGKFCEFIGSNRMGTQPVCTLFPDPDVGSTHTRLMIKDGWIQRCDACKNADEVSHAS